MIRELNLIIKGSLDDEILQLWAKFFKYLLTVKTQYLYRVHSAVARRRRTSVISNARLRRSSQRGNGHVMGQLIYAFVARGQTVLCEYTTYTGNFSQIATQVRGGRGLWNRGDRLHMYPLQRDRVALTRMTSTSPPHARRVCVLSNGGGGRG